jgi:hypothetical protein
MSWRAQSRSKDAKTPSTPRGRSENPEPDCCPIQLYLLFALGHTPCTQGPLGGETQSRKQGIARALRRHRAQSARNPESREPRAEIHRPCVWEADELFLRSYFAATQIWMSLVAITCCCLVRYAGKMTSHPSRAVMNTLVLVD